MHPFLISSNLFSSSLDGGALNLFPFSNAEEISKHFIFHFDFKESLMKNANAIEWILQITSFLMAPPKDGSTFIALQTWQKFYSNILKLDEIPDQKFFCYFVRNSLLHFSKWFTCPKFGINISPALRDISDLILKKYSIFDKITWDSISRTVLGLCTYMFSPSVNKDPFDFNNSVFNSLFQLSFQVLSFSSLDSLDSWNLFNHLISTWPKSLSFQQNWIYFFNSVYSSLLKKDIPLPKFENSDEWIDAIEISKNNSQKTIPVMIQILLTAQTLSKTQNSEALHKSFLIVARQTHEEKILFSDFFEYRHSVDSILSLFTKWALSEVSDDPNNSRNESVASFMTILEKCQTKPNSKWFQSAIEFFKYELRDGKNSPIIPYLLPQLNRLLCSHTSSFRHLIGAIMKYLGGQTNISKSYIVSLVLSITEIYIQEHQLKFGTIGTVEQLLPKLFPPAEDYIKNKDKVNDELDQTIMNYVKSNIQEKVNIEPYDHLWSLQLIIELLSGSIETFKKEFLSFFFVRPSDFLLFYLLFAKEICPFIYLQDSSEFFWNIIKTIKETISFHNLTHFYAFIYSTIEISRKYHIFEKDSQEFSFLKSSQDEMISENIITDEENLAFQFALSSFISGRPVLDLTSLPSTTDPEWIHYSLKNGIASFRLPSDDRNPIDLIFRNAFGTYAFTISEILLPDVQVQMNPFSPTYSNRELEIEEPEKNQMINLSDKFDYISIPEIEELGKITQDITFKEYQQIVPMKDKVFGFLSGIGIINSIEIYSAKEIIDIQDVLKDFNSIPTREEISVVLMHFTKDFPNPPGTTILSPKYLKFINYLGISNPNQKSTIENGTEVFKYIYYDAGTYCADSDTLIIFNETGCIPIRSAFEALPYLTIISIEEKDTGIYEIELIKGPLEIHFPLLRSQPRLISDRALAPTLEYCSLSTTFHHHFAYFEVNRQERRRIISELYESLPSGNPLSFLFSK